MHIAKRLSSPKVANCQTADQQVKGENIMPQKNINDQLNRPIPATAGDYIVAGCWLVVYFVLLGLVG